MSRLPLVPHCVLVAGLAAAAVGVGAAPALAASTATIGYQCKIPLIGQVPVSVTYSLDTPDTWPLNTATPPFGVTAAVTFPALGGLAQVVVPDSAQGEIKLDSTVLTPEGLPLRVKVPLELPKTVFPVAPGTVQGVATGAYPSLVFEAPGTASVTIDKLAMNLRFFEVDGEPFPFPSGPVFDIEGNPVVPSDNDPNTIDISCKANAGQDNTLATFEILANDDSTPPTDGNLDAIPRIRSVELSWTPATDDTEVVAYEVFQDGVLAETLSGTDTSFIVYGLDPSTEYAFKVVAVDAAGNRSEGATVETATMAEWPTTVDYSYDLAGTAGLNTLTKGNLPIGGRIDAKLTLATGEFAADLALNPTRGRLIAAGFLPVTAKIAFVPSGKTTGTLLDGVLESASKVRIKVQEVKLFGAIPLAGGNNCQTKQLSDIKLKSTDEFKPLQGGNIAGTFSISDLNGCGPLNGLVSPLTAGGGNTIKLKLAPRVSAAS